MSLTSPLRIGTRGSPLALAQANQTRDRLLAAHGLPDEAVEIHIIKTSGDAILDRPLSEAGGKGLFTKELDTALMMGGIDIAVHSAKDLPTFLPDAIAISGYLPREDVRDAWISPVAATPRDLPQGAKVGTASLRRGAMLKRIRPDVAITLLRGNVHTRLRKLAEGEADATLLAAAGLDRLSRPDVGYAVPIDVMLPAPAQGAVGIEARAGDAATLALLAAIDHAGTHLCVRAERALLAALGADCHSPMAALARIEDDMIEIGAEILSEDGADRRADRMAIPIARPDEAAALADRLLAAAPPSLARLFTGR